jgi:ATP synthase protein I
MCIGVPVTYFLAGLPSAVSLFCGATCAVVPQAYFAAKMQGAGKQNARRAARIGLAAEGMKFVISATAFALVFAVVKPQHPGLVFLGFGFLWLVQLIDGARLLRLPQ